MCNLLFVSPFLMGLYCLMLNRKEELTTTLEKLSGNKKTTTVFAAQASPQSTPEGHTRWQNPSGIASGMTAGFGHNTQREPWKRALLKPSGWHVGCLPPSPAVCLVGGGTTLHRHPRQAELNLLHIQQSRVLPAEQSFHSVSQTPQSLATKNQREPWNGASLKLSR